MCELEQTKKTIRVSKGFKNSRHGGKTRGNIHK
jgi:hypothetical protein